MSPCACRGFFKTYKDMSSSHQNTLCDFYEATQDTSFVEEDLSFSNSESLKLRLTPVGESRLPTTVFEMKVSNCPSVALIRSRPEISGKLLGAIDCQMLAPTDCNTHQVLKTELLAVFGRLLLA